MEIYMPNFSYIFLTNEIPAHTYELSSGYTLKPIKSTPEMLRGFSLDNSEEYNALMALPHINDDSFETYKDLVVFHSFISNNPRTYEFAESITETTLETSKLTFIEDISNTELGKIIAVDFDFFPVPTELDEREAIVKYTSHKDINYREAFDLFSKLKLKEKTRELYNQICLCVFARSLESITKIYSNTYVAVSFYITILESIIGKPPTCNETLTCPKCGRKIADHTTISLEKHFTNSYGERFKKLRNIRHMTFHKGEYSDLIASWLKLYMELYKTGAKSSRELEKIGRLQVKIGDLDIIVQDRLKTLFLKQYREYQIH
jgi:hypothetical protein